MPHTLDDLNTLLTPKAATPTAAPVPAQTTSRDEDKAPNPVKPGKTFDQFQQMMAASAQKQKPVLQGKSPEDEPDEQSYARNKGWAKPGPYLTTLVPDQEKGFQKWVKDNKINWREGEKGYDMRGYYQALQRGEVKMNTEKSGFDNKIHFVDRFKTPYDATFSGESQYATKGAPHWDDHDRLVGADGQVIVDESYNAPEERKPTDNRTVKEKVFGGKGDLGAVGRGWEALKEAPVAPGETVRDLWERFFNPLGRTDVGQSFHESEKDIEDTKAGEGRGGIAKSLIALNRGVGDAIEEQFSGFNMALLLAGPIAAAGKETVTEAGAMGKALGKLAQFYFTTQMTMGAADAANASIDAFRSGDYQTGIKMAVGGLINGLMAHHGFQEQVAHEQVHVELNQEAQKAEGKPFEKLTPEGKARAIYNVANQHPFMKDLEAGETPSKKTARDYKEKSDIMQGMVAPPTEKVKTDASDAALRAAGNAVLKQQSDEEALRKRAKDAALNEFKVKVKNELDAIPAPTKRAMQDPPVVLDVPQQPQTPEAREQAAYDTRKEEASRLLESEKALEATRKEEQDRKDAEWTKRREDEQEQAPFTIVDKRAVPGDAVSQHLRAEIASQVVPKSAETQAYENLDGLLRDHARSLYPDREAGPGVIYERLREKRREGFALEPAEDFFLTTYARRERAARNLIDPKSRSAAAELVNQMDRDQVQRIIQLASREHGLYRAAQTLQRQAMEATTADDADLKAQQAAEAQELAEKLRTEREAEQARRVAAKEPEPVIERGAPKAALAGNAARIAMPDGRNLPVRYSAMRLSQLIVSHDPFSFEWNPKYVPRGMQPRDLSTNEEARHAIEESRKPGVYESDRYTSDDPTSQNGPAIILPDGRVAGGNSRLLRLMQALETGRRRDIIDELNRSLGKFGVEHLEVPDYADPLIPVRVLDDFPETTEDLVRLGQDLNRDHMLGFTPAEQSVMDGQRLTSEDVEVVAAWMDQLENPSLRKVLATRGTQIFDLMVKRGVIAENKRAAYMVPGAHGAGNGELTEDAKIEFERMIMGRVIDDADLLATTPKSIYAKAERSIAALVKIKASNDGWNILDYMKDAMREWRQIDSIRDELTNLGSKDDLLVDRYYRPQDFKMGTATLTGLDLRPEPHPTTYALVRLLEEKPTDVNAALTRYADEAEARQASLVPRMSPLEAFNQFIGKRVHVEVSPLDWAKSTPATEEQKAKFKEEEKRPTQPTTAQKEQQEKQTIDPLPGMQRAEEQLKGEVSDGSVTPESLREFFNADPRFAGWSDDLMTIFGKIIPNATGMRLDEFLKKAFTELRYANWAESETAGRHPEIRDNFPRGAYERQINGPKKILSIFEGGQVATVVHEFFHAMRPYLQENDMRVLEEWAHDELAKKGKAAEFGVWGEDKEEITARAFEKYLAKGEAPTEGMKGVFQRLRDAFRQIYYVLLRKAYRLPDDSPIKVTITPELRETFDSWFGKAREEVGERNLEKPKEAVTGFKTAQGSTYTVEKEGTKRTKSQHPGHLPTDVGEKPQSSRTVYVSPKDASEIGAWMSVNKESQPTARITPEGIELTSRYGVENGKPYAKTRRKIIPFEKEPKIGASPVEFWEGGKVHAGNEITELTRGGQSEELPPPPSSIETDISPEERESLLPGFHGPVHYNEVDGTPRVKRFENLDDARAWAMLNRTKFKGMTTWTTPDGKAVSMFVPLDETTLFQMGPPPAPAGRGPRNLQEILQRLDQLKKAKQDPLFAKFNQTETDFEIRMLEAKSGLSRAVLDSMSMSPPPTESGIINLSRPPEYRPPVTPGQSAQLFPQERMTPPRAETRPEESKPESRPPERPREVPDAGVPLRPARGPDGVVESTPRPAVDPKIGTSGPGGRDRPGRPGARPTGRVSDPGQTRRDRPPDLIDVRPVEVAQPTRMRGTPTVEASSWRYRMAELRMPVDVPAPTVKLDSNIAAVLGRFPGQVEVAESTASALVQYDGAVIATPTGTGKTFTTLAVAKHLEQQGAKRGLVVTMNRKIIDQRNGWKDVAKKYFGLKMDDLPRDKKLSSMKDGRYVTTYAQLMKRKGAMNYAWDYVIFDESAAARRWYDPKTQQGDSVRKLSDVAKKAIYVSATPFHEALEYGYMTKLGLWKPGEFDKWVHQFGARKAKNGVAWSDHGVNPKMLVKLRDQLIARGQFITQERNFEGYTAHFALVPTTGEVRAGLASADRAFAEAQRFFRSRGKTNLAEAAKRVAATYKKAYLERSRLPETIEIMKQAKKQGWQVVVFSETDKAHEQMYEFMEQADAAMDGRLSQLLPNFPAVYDTLAKEFGEESVGNYSGSHSSKRSDQLNEWLAARKDFLFATYSAGGTGVSMHDDSSRGVHPRMAIYLGPSYSGIAFEQAMGRLWRYGTNSDVHSVFMTSDAVPEVQMMINKIAPRLAALKAAIGGIETDDPMVRRMRNAEDAHTEGAGYDLGSKITYDAADFKPANEHIPIANWKDVQLKSAERAKGKGMKYPGQVSKPGVIESERLFQMGGDPILPERFLSPEEASARLMNEEIMQALADGESVPHAGDELKNIDPGDRILIADGVGPRVAQMIEQAVKDGEDPEAAARNAIRTGITEILAAKRAGEVDALPEGGYAEGGKKGPPGWEMRQKAGAPETPEPPIEDNSPISAHYWLMSGRKNIEAVTKQAGVPEIGLKITRDIREYWAQGAGHAGQFTGEYFKIIQDNKLTPAEHRLMWMAKEGKIPPPNERIARAVQGVTAIMNRIRQMAAEKNIHVEYYDDQGIKQSKPFADILDDPNYMPHIHDYKEKISVKDPTTGKEQTFTLQELLGGTLSDIKRNAILDAMERQTGKSRAQLERALAARKRRTPLGGNIERSRGADLPFYRMDQGAMLHYFESVGETFARADLFGQNREKLDGIMAQISNPKAHKVVNGIMDQLLKPRPWDTQLGKMYSRLATVEILSKMVFSPIKVPFHLAHTTVVQESLVPALKGVLMTAANYKEMKNRAILSGALMEQIRAEQILEQGSDLRLANQWLSATGFNWMYNFARTSANAAAQTWMEGALPKLVKKAKVSAHIREQLRNDYLMSDEQIDAAIKSKKWTRDDLRKGAAALVQKTMFTNDPTELPPHWRGRSDEPASDNLHMFARMMTILKSFTFKTANLLKERLVDEARKGNLKPWIPFLMAYPLAGEAMRGLGALAQTAASQSLTLAATGQGQAQTAFDRYTKGLEDLFDDPTIAKAAQRWLDDVGASTATEMFTHVMDVVMFPNKSKRIAQFQLRELKWDALKDIFGSTYTDIFEFGDLIANMLGTATQEDGEKMWEKEEKLLSAYGREFSPILRGVLPSGAKTTTYQMAPPP